ncbi:MAG: hypothetical protein OEQ29_21355 [Alphaproteobacteria bacterium]|nr:hypothetical protein [Alphaproteobacteria bacterium]
MATFVLTLVIVLASVAGLATGVLLGCAPLRGSCGGVACVKGGGCAACQTHQHVEDTP